MFVKCKVFPAVDVFQCAFVLRDSQGVTFFITIFLSLLLLFFMSRGHAVQRHKVSLSFLVLHNNDDEEDLALIKYC